MMRVSASVVFAETPRPKLMQSCLDVFGALGFRREDLDIVTCDGTMNAKPTREWLRKWGLSWRVNASDQFGRDRMLKLMPTWVVVGPKQPEGATPLSQRHQAEGICFLIRMAAIRFVT